MSASWGWAQPGLGRAKGGQRAGKGRTIHKGRTIQISRGIQILGHGSALYESRMLDPGSRSTGIHNLKTGRVFQVKGQVTGSTCWITGVFSTSHGFHNFDPGSVIKSVSESKCRIPGVCKIVGVQKLDPGSVLNKSRDPNVGSQERPEEVTGSKCWIPGVR